MAVKLHGAAGWTITEESAYTGTVSERLGTSDGAGECGVIHTGAGQAIDIFTVGGYLSDQWVCGRDCRVEDWSGSPGDQSSLVISQAAANFVLYLRYVSAGAGFNVGLSLHGAAIVWGSDTFAWSPTTHHWRVSMDGVRTMLEFGDPLAEQVNVADSDQLGPGRLTLRGIITNAASMYHKEVVICSGDSGDDRPGPSTLDIVKMVPSADSALLDEFAVPAANKYAEVDDWDSGDSDGDTTDANNPATANTTFRSAFVTANQTLSNIRGLMAYTRIRASVASKDLTFHFISSDGTVYEEVQIGLVADSYMSGRALFQLAPDGGAWTQTDLNNFEIGARWDVGEDPVALRMTAAQAEAVGFDLDAGEIPAPVATANVTFGTVIG